MSAWQQLKTQEFIHWILTFGQLFLFYPFQFLAICSPIWIRRKRDHHSCLFLELCKWPSPPLARVWSVNFQNCSRSFFRALDLSFQVLRYKKNMPMKRELSDQNTVSCIRSTNLGQPSIKELNVARLHCPITPSSLQLGSSLALSPLKVVNLTLFDDADLFTTGSWNSSWGCPNQDRLAKWGGF